MSKYRVRPYDLTGIKTYPLESRPSKVAIDLFGRPHERGAPFQNFSKAFQAFWHPAI